MKLPLVIGLLLCLNLPASATTVAWDGRLIASDSQTTYGNVRMLGSHKLTKHGKLAIGTCGSVKDGIKFRIWWDGKCEGPYPKVGDDFSAMVVSRTFGGLLFSDSIIPVPISAPFAIGSGSDMALGAMNSGQDAIGAVKAAEKSDIFTGGPIQ